MKAHYADDRATVFSGDCLDVMRGWADESVDAIVTDPPYGLGFMGHKWDHMPPGVEWAEECLRVLKPGGHLLAFGGSRTWHRLAVAVEDAGFEVRDSIAWLYGSGFPKSLDVSKAIDKAAPRYEMFGPFAVHYAERRVAAGLNHREVCEAGKFYAEHNKGGASVNWEKGYNVPTLAQWATLAPLLGLSDEFLPLIERIEAERDVTGRHLNAITTGDAGLTARGEGKERRDMPATPDAERWQGWGTALKPAFEPIVCARKPLAGSTVAANVLEHGTGALNIDGCRVGDAGRWPANVVLDEEMAEVLDEQSGPVHWQATNNSRAGSGWGIDQTTEDRPKYDAPKRIEEPGGGGPSKFFPTFRYQAKAPKSERPRVDGVAHPTVKPLDLMRWLVRLVTPPDGIVLDPFAGSGATLEAALLEGFQCVGIELADEYLPLIVHRIERAQAGRGEGAAAPLFNMEDEVG